MPVTPPAGLVVTPSWPDTPFLSDSTQFVITESLEGSLSSPVAESCFLHDFATSAFTIGGGATASVNGTSFESVAPNEKLAAFGPSVAVTARESRGEEDVSSLAVFMGDCERPLLLQLLS